MYTNDFSYFKERLTTMSHYLESYAIDMDVLSTYENVSKTDIDVLDDIVADIIESVNRLEAEIKSIRNF